MCQFMWQCTGRSSQPLPAGTRPYTLSNDCPINNLDPVAWRRIRIRIRALLGGFCALAGD